MSKEFAQYNLADEEVTAIKVFMLLYNYASIETLVKTRIIDLRKHKGWNTQLESLILKIQRFNSPFQSLN